MQALIMALRQFAAERDWDQFHSPKNLSMALAVEAAELMEHFQWLTEAESQALAPDKLAQVGEEVADVLLYLLRLCDKLGIDPVQAARQKLDVNRDKYPPDEARGRADKYTAYQAADQETKGGRWMGDHATSGLAEALGGLDLPQGVTLRAWEEADFAQVRQMAMDAGWTSYRDLPERLLAAWKGSWPALVAVERGEVIGFLRAVTDGAMTLYVADVVVHQAHRGRGIAHLLLRACRQLYATARLDLLSVPEAVGFYAHLGFQPFKGYRLAAEADFVAGEPAGREQAAGVEPE